MKLKSKVLFLIGLIFILCSSSTFAMSINNSTATIYFPGNSSYYTNSGMIGEVTLTNINAGNAGITAKTTTEGISLCFNYDEAQNSSFSQSAPYSNSRSSAVLDILIEDEFITNGTNGEITINNSEDDTLLTIAVTTTSLNKGSYAGQGFTPSTVNVYPSNNQTSQNIQMTGVNNVINNSLTQEDLSSRGVNLINYAPNQILSQVYENLGTVSNQSSNNNNYNGVFTLAKEDIYSTPDTANPYYVNASVEYSVIDGSDRLANVMVFPIQLNVFPEITSLEFSGINPTVTPEDITNYSTENVADYYVGNGNYAQVGEEIYIAGNSTDPEDNILINNDSGDLPCLNLNLSDEAPTDVDTLTATVNQSQIFGEINPNGTDYDSEDAYDVNAYNLQESVSFVVTDPGFATVSGKGTKSSIDFIGGGSYGSTHLYAEVNNLQTSFVPSEIGVDSSNQPEINNVNPCAYQQYINLSYSPESELILNNASFACQNLTFYNQTETSTPTAPVATTPLATGFTVSSQTVATDEATLLTSAVNNLTWTLAYQNDTGITYTADKGAFKNKDGATLFTLVPNIPNYNPGPNTIGLAYTAEAQAQPGVYTLSVTYTDINGNEQQAQTTINVVAGNMPNGNIYITQDGQRVESITVDSLESIQFETTQTGTFVGDSGIFWTVNDPTNQDEGTQRVDITPDGLLTISGTMDVGSAVVVTAYQYGVASDPVYVSLSPAAIPDQTGLEAIKDPVYLYPGSTGYEILYNVQPVPVMAEWAGRTPQDYNLTMTPATNPNATIDLDKGTLNIGQGAAVGSSFTVNVEYKENIKFNTSFTVNIIAKTPATSMTVPSTLPASIGQPVNIDWNLLPERNTSIVCAPDGDYITNDTETLSDGGFYEALNPVYGTSNEAVVRYNPATKGLIAVGEGSATVYTTLFTYDGCAIFTGQTQVTVGPQEEVTTITATPSTVTIKLGETADVAVTTTPAGYETLVDWTVTDPTIVSVEEQTDGSLVLTGLADGTTTITGTYGDVTATINVTVNETGAVNPESVEITPDPVYLTTLTGTGYINSQALTITPTPADATLDNLTLSSTVPTVATVAQGEDGSWTVNAVSEGVTDINAVVTGTDTVLGTATVFVNDDQVICTSLVATPSIPGNPDYYDVTATGVQGNPAMGLQNAQIEKVSIFNWSTANQSDMNAKIAESMGNGVYGYDNFPVNNTNENFIIADQIYIHVYGKIVGQAGDGNYLGAANRSWMDDIPATAGNMAYIGYSQNVGFDQSSQFTTNAVPTTFIGSTGNARQMEGLRISSNIPGVEVQTSVHVQDLDWQPYVADGTYAGTMHRNLQIEAMRLQLTGPNAPNYTIQYRVHQQDLSWSAWTSDGQIAGVTGQGLQMEAAQVRIVPVGTALPQ